MDYSSAPQVNPEVGPVVKSMTNDPQKRDLMLKRKKDDFKSYMQKLLEKEGLGVPMRMEMERIIVRKLGSRLMEDVLTGRCDTIGFEDFLKRPERTDKEFQPRSKGEKLFNTRSKR